MKVHALYLEGHNQKQEENMHKQKNDKSNKEKVKTMRNGKTKGVQKWYSKQQLTISNKMVFN